MKSIPTQLSLLALVVSNASGQLATYEFTGASTGNNQFNDVTLQPDHGVFGSFQRVNVDWASGANVFNSKSWNTGLSLDPSEYVGFTITADAGFSLDLSQVSFGSSRSSSGPLNGQVSLFLENSATPAESVSFSSGTTLGTTTFDFSDVTGASQAEFRFYGFGGSSALGTLRLDDVAVSGSITPVPEPEEYSLVAGVMMVIYATARQWKKNAALRNRSVTA